jgi:hypothetical protein
MTKPCLTKEHFVHHGERGTDGFYYAYWEYQIELGERCHGARVYDDESDVAFVHTAPSPRRADRNLDDLAVLLDVLRPEGVSEIRMLGRSGGYERVELLDRRPGGSTS